VKASPARHSKRDAAGAVLGNTPGAAPVLFLLSLLLAACSSERAGGAGTGAVQAKGASLVIVSIDTLRADRLPAYGYTGVETPAIDGLRKDAILFENAYTHSPLTLPSHASLLSGLLPPEHGVRNNIGYKLDARHETLAEALRARGYATGAAVSAFVLRRTTGIGEGFEHYDDVVTAAGAKALGEVQRPGLATVERALVWLRGARERPFFLFVHVYEPHAPWTPPEPQRARYGATYEGEVAAADAAVGALLDGLRSLGRYDESLVALVSDHGEGLSDHGEPEHGILLYREALHVPLLLKLPRSARAGTTQAAPVGLRDLVPTLAKALAVPAPAAAHGRDLLSGAGAESAGVYSETYYPRIHLGWSELRSLTDARYQLIDGPRPELYDVVRDPGQKNDILKEKPQVATAMRAAIAATASDFVAPAPASREERERLQSLGYLAGGASAPEATGSARPNPRDHIASYVAARAAFALVEQGKDAEAVRAFDRVLRDEPGFLDVHTERAGALGRLGRYRDSEAAYRAAIEKAPELAGALSLTLARVQLEMGDLDAAREGARKALATESDAAHELLASVALAAGQLDEAEREAAQAATDPGARARATVVRAEVASRRGQPDAALQLLEGVRREGAALGPVPWLEFVRGDVLARLGRHAEAEQALRAEIQAFPSHARAYASLAIVRALQGAPLAESRQLLDEMSRAAPGAGSRELAAKALAFIGDEAGAARWRASKP
jgi:arylsulfatase A-like enzyme/tetratricopeptide (TPR) repeat protein